MEKEHQKIYVSAPVRHATAEEREKISKLKILFSEEGYEILKWWREAENIPEDRANPLLRYQFIMNRIIECDLLVMIFNSSECSEGRAIEVIKALELGKPILAFAFPESNPKGLIIGALQNWNHEIIKVTNTLEIISHLKKYKI